MDRIEYNEDGSLDEVVAGGAHLESMGGKRWFLAMRRADGSEFCIWFKGKITFTEERPCERGEAVTISSPQICPQCLLPNPVKNPYCFCKPDGSGSRG